MGEEGREGGRKGKERRRERRERKREGGGGDDFEVAEREGRRVGDAIRVENSRGIVFA